MEEITKAKAFECPHCGKPIQVMVRTEIVEVTSLQDQEGNINWDYGLTDNQRQLIDLARESGVLSAFEQAVKEAKADQMPKSIERFLLTFLKTAVPRNVPQRMLHYFIDLYNGDRVEFWTAQGVMAVTSNGVIRTFIPQDFVMGKVAKTPMGKSTSVRMGADEYSFSNWMVSKTGDVRSRGGRLDMMRRRARGQFERDGR